MKRDILNHNRRVCGCCPGHDTFPDETYANHRSKRARSRNIALEHQTVRAIQNRILRQEIEQSLNNAM